MSKKQKMWVYMPQKRPKPKVEENVKRDLEHKAELIIKEILKPEHIKPPIKDTSFNYIVDIYTKWYRNYFYFCAKYHCPGPNAMSPYFESKFARLEYIGNNIFNLSFMRHTEQWVEIYTELSLGECLSVIKDDPIFHP